MKVRIISSLILLIPVLGFSQINQSIDFISGIERTFENLPTLMEDGTVTEGRIIKSGDSKKIKEFNWRIGFDFNRRITKRIFLKTGLRLSSVENRYTRQLRAQWSTGHITFLQEMLVDDYWFAEIPIAGRFEMNQRKLAAFFELGISPSIFIKTKSIANIEAASTPQNVTKSHITGFMSLGVNYSLSDRLQLFGQPVVRYYLTEIAESSINEKFIISGIEIGIRRKIN